jgi:alkylated DNA nucleotide flippase Atl1
LQVKHVNFTWKEKTLKRIAIMAAFLAGCLFVTNGYAQQALQTGPDQPAAAGHQGRARTEKEAKLIEPKHVFSGKVAQVDVPTAIFSLKENGNTVGFDASKPVFSGYRSLSDMHTGDRVAVSYTVVDGLRVTMLSERLAPMARGEVQTERQPAAEAPAGKRARVVGRLLKREKKVDWTGFSYADVKKDGRITPVGLSVVIKDVTMDEFRQYDKNHKGYLDKAEFLEAVKHLRAGRDRFGSASASWTVRKDKSF